MTPHRGGSASWHWLSMFGVARTPRATTVPRPGDARRGDWQARAQMKAGSGSLLRGLRRRDPHDAWPAPSSRTSTPRPSRRPSPRPGRHRTRARTFRLAPTRSRPRSRTCPRATPSRPRGGASCAYSPHVKSHAAHSPRVDVRVRVMKTPIVSSGTSSRRRRWGWDHGFTRRVRDSSVLR